MKIYRHYKGDLYVELMRGFLESNLTEMVIYTAISPDLTITWVRPAFEFDGVAAIDDFDGVGAGQVKRFTYIGDTPQ